MNGHKKCYRHRRHSTGIDESLWQAAGSVVSDLWENWDEGVDLYNCNVPLGFKGPDGNPVQPQTLRTSVDPISYASLYSKPFNLIAIIQYM